MKSILSKFGCTAFLAASFAVSNPLIAAQDDTYNANDLLLFLQNPAGTTGTDKVVYYSLGNSVGVFRNAPGGTVTFLGNINSKLTEVFGADWTGLEGSIYAGAAGQNGATHAAATTIVDGDYARTVYVTKPRTSVGIVGEANSSSPLFDPAQTAVAGNIAGSNSISGMTQPGVVAVGDTLLDWYNSFSYGNPATAYGAISGGIQNKISNSTVTFGTVGNVVTALDLYRVTKTTGTNASSNSTWHIADFETPEHVNNSYPGKNGARADFLGTLTLSNNGSVNFVSVISPVGQPPFINSATTANGTAGSAFTAYTIVATNNPTTFSSTTLPDGLLLNSVTGVISGTPTVAGTSAVSISATNAGGTDTKTLTITIAAAATTPTITTQPTVSSITYGQTLASAVLSGGTASVAGTFAFTTPSTAPSVGTTTHSVTFTPTDSGNYTNATGNVSVTVAKATPTITTQPSASAITSGQSLASSTLSGGVGSVVGTFAFTTPGTVPAVGSAQQSFTFTPTDSANYNIVSGSVSVIVEAPSGGGGGGGAPSGGGGGGAPSGGGGGSSQVQKKKGKSSSAKKSSSSKKSSSATKSSGNKSGGKKKSKK